LRLLIDENISPQTASFLRELGHDVESVRRIEMGADDEAIVETALEEGRAIITQDTDFGNIYYFAERSQLTVVVVRPSTQSVETINEILEKFLNRADAEHGLYILTETGVRTRK
jgi:predicted nuclease of predicted toxin-antitoxin system